MGSCSTADAMQVMAWWCEFGPVGDRQRVKEAGGAGREDGLDDAAQVQEQKEMRGHMKSLGGSFSGCRVGQS